MNLTGVDITADQWLRGRGEFSLDYEYWTERRLKKLIEEKKQSELMLNNRKT